MELNNKMYTKHSVVCIKKYACGVSRSERMGVLERGVPGTLEAGDGTGELV